jgi:hypothetical protein
MLRKSHTLALAVATAGVIGFGAPMASAATTSAGPGNNGAWGGGWSNSNNGGWSNNNGGWSNNNNGGWGQRPPKHHKRAQTIQICNNIIVINLIVGQKQYGDTPGPDPAYGGEPMYGKPTSILNNNCYNQQFNGYQG